MKELSDSTKQTMRKSFPKTALIVDYGHYAFARKPVGLKNAPFTF